MKIFFLYARVKYLVDSKLTSSSFFCCFSCCSSFCAHDESSSIRSKLMFMSSWVVVGTISNLFTLNADKTTHCTSNGTFDVVEIGNILRSPFSLLLCNGAITEFNKFQHFVDVLSLCGFSLELGAVSDVKMSNIECWWARKNWNFSVFLFLTSEKLHFLYFGEEFLSLLFQQRKVQVNSCDMRSSCLVIVSPNRWEILSRSKFLIAS